jgi:hypothetical protein
MNVNLGVFITTHITLPKDSSHRHGASVMARQLDYYSDKVIENYIRYPSGVSSTTIFICDTGCTHPDFDTRVIDKVRTASLHSDNNTIFTHLKIPNHGGCVAALKYVMHNDPRIMNNYDYFLFHVDDGVEPVESGWGADIISHYNDHGNLGVLGRQLDQELIGPAGMVDHRNICAHIAVMWNIKHVTQVPHLHADWWLMDRDTIKELSKVWIDPVHSDAAMAYQLAHENRDFTQVCADDPTRNTVDNIHIGRESEISLRVGLFNKDVAGYGTNKINTRPLHKRPEYK